MRKAFIIAISFAVIASAAVYILYISDDFEARKTAHHLVVTKASVLLGFDLQDPVQSPPAIRKSVERGYHILMNTPKHLGAYIPDSHLSCTNCHFGGGDSLGGPNNGISLVGVTSVYPQYSERFKTHMTLKMRINNCFERSMNGKPIPEDSQAMQDIINYLEWISKEVAHLHAYPWLGLPEIKSTHTPDPVNGKQIYITQCALCHKKSGEGSQTAPALWGDHSFNDGAGMNKLSMLAPFILQNMPQGNAFLSEEQALDVAAYVQQQTRPKFEDKQ